MSEVNVNDLLGSKEKKLTVLLPAEMHNTIKTMAYSQGKSVKELIIECYYEYLKPTYSKEVK